MSRPFVTLELTIPADVARVIAADADAFMLALQGIVDAARRANLQEEHAAFVRDADRRQAERASGLMANGRRAHRILREMLRTLPGSVKGASRQQQRQAFVAEIAADFAMRVEYVDLAIKRHNQHLRSRIRQRRERHALRYATSGLTDREIAERLGVTLSTAKRDLQAVRLRAKRQDISLFELERRVTAALHEAWEVRL